MDSVIYAENLNIAYRDDEFIIKNTKINIKSGDFVFITGKSGSGKSTLLKSLYGALEPRDGTLKVCGVDMQDVSSSKLNFLRKHIGIVFQDYRLIKEWSVQKNIMLPLLVGGFSKDVCVNQSHKLLKHVKLLHKADKFPMELSGGEQQRIAMARALAHNPIVILADEPTGNLDDYSSDVIWQLLKGAKEHLGATVIVVTHKIPSAVRINYKHFFLDSGVLHEVP